MSIPSIWPANYDFLIFHLLGLYGGRYFWFGQHRRDFLRQRLPRTLDGVSRNARILGRPALEAEDASGPSGGPAPATPSRDILVPLTMGATAPADYSELGILLVTVICLGLLLPILMILLINNSPLRSH